MLASRRSAGEHVRCFGLAGLRAGPGLLSMPTPRVRSTLRPQDTLRLAALRLLPKEREDRLGDTFASTDGGNMVARLEQVDPVIAGHGPLPVTEAPEPITEIGRSIWQKDGARVRGQNSPAYRLAPLGETRQRLGTSKVRLISRDFRKATHTAVLRDRHYASF
jgi:hypothetical protein